MKLSIFRIIIILSIGSIFLSGSFSSINAQEKKKKKFELPAAIKDAFKKAYPKGTIKNFDKETTDGKEMFEVESMDRKQRRDFLYLPDGTVYEMEEVILIKNLPKEIQETLKKEFPKGKCEKAEKLMRGAIIKFELSVKSGKDKYDVSLDATGKILKSTKVVKKAKNEKDEDDEKENKK